MLHLSVLRIGRRFKLLEQVRKISGPGKSSFTPSVSCSWKLGCIIRFNSNITNRSKPPDSKQGVTGSDHNQSNNCGDTPPQKFPSNRTFTSEVYTIPNLITISRILVSPYLGWLIYTVGYAILSSMYQLQLIEATTKDQKEAALVGVAIAGFSDWADGYIARKFNQQTVLGAFLDPAADKIVIGFLTLGLTLKGLLPVVLAVVIIGRDALILFMGFVQRAREKPKDAIFFDTTSSATFEIIPSELSKVSKCSTTFFLSPHSVQSIII